MPILVQKWLNTREDSVKVRFVHFRGELGPWLNDLDLIELFLILGILDLNLLDHVRQLSEFVRFELLTQCFYFCLELWAYILELKCVQRFLGPKWCLIRFIFHDVLPFDLRRNLSDSELKLPEPQVNHLLVDLFH